MTTVAEDNRIAVEDGGANSVIFQHTTHRKDECGTSRSIVVTRYPSGDVEMVVSIWTERDDASRHSYLLSPDEGEQLGRALCCVDGDTFDGLVGRSTDPLKTPVGEGSSGLFRHGTSETIFNESGNGQRIGTKCPIRVSSGERGD